MTAQLQKLRNNVQNQVAHSRQFFFVYLAIVISILILLVIFASLSFFFPSQSKVIWLIVLLIIIFFLIVGYIFFQLLFLAQLRQAVPLDTFAHNTTLGSTSS